MGEGRGRTLTKSTQRRVMRSQADRLGWSVIVGLYVAPMAALVYGLHLIDEEPITARPAPEPVTALPERVEVEEKIDVEADLRWSPGAALIAPAWSGLISDVAIDIGDQVRTGDRVVRIDGVWRIAAATPFPFHAPVDAFSPARELSALSALLADFGYEVPRGKWSHATLKAVRAVATRLDVPNAIGVTAFDPSWVLWMRERELVLDSINLQVGSIAPAQGDFTAQGAPELAAISLSSPMGAALPPSDEAAEWTIRLDGMELPYAAIDSVEALRSVDVPSPLASSEPEALTGALTRRTPVTGWNVPVGAVHTDIHGVQCVFHVGPDRSYRAVEVSIRDGGAGVALVTADLEEGVAILLNPADTQRDQECG